MSKTPNLEALEKAWGPLADLLNKRPSLSIDETEELAKLILDWRLLVCAVFKDRTFDLISWNGAMTQCNIKGIIIFSVDLKYDQND